MTSAKKEFKNVEPMLCELSWKMQRHCGLPFEEIRSEAYHAFMKACESYVPGTAKFSSWCYLKVSCHLKHWLRNRAKDRLVFVDEVVDEMLPQSTATFRATLLDQLQDLSPDAKRLIDTILAKAGPDAESHPRQLLAEAVEQFQYDNGITDDVYTRIIIHEIKEEIHCKST